jgi:hypothetical protein
MIISILNKDFNPYNLFVGTQFVLYTNIENEGFTTSPNVHRTGETSP